MSNIFAKDSNAQPLIHSHNGGTRKSF